MEHSVDCKQFISGLLNVSMIFAFSFFAKKVYCSSNSLNIWQNYSIQYSRVVSHRSTDWTVSCLTSAIGRERVFSWTYGRSYNMMCVLLFIFSTEQIYYLVLCKYFQYLVLRKYFQYLVLQKYFHRCNDTRTSPCTPTISTQQGEMSNLDKSQNNGLNLRRS